MGHGKNGAPKVVVKPVWRCPMCGVDLTAKAMATHLKREHPITERGPNIKH